jgi:hypothetical protein
MNKAGAMNKAGFDEAQQKELMDLIDMATMVAEATTEHVIGTPEEEGKALLKLYQFVRDTYPKGPLHLKESLDEIISFCDLPTIIGTHYGKRQE